MQRFITCAPFGKTTNIFFSDRLDLQTNAASYEGGAFVQDTKDRGLPQNERQE
jgi:hypothetical protein